MSFTENNVMDALRNVIDPDLKQDIVSLGMVKNIVISDNGDVAFTVVLTTPACPLKEVIHNACVNAIKHYIKGSKEIRVEMTSNVTSSGNTSSNMDGGFKYVKNTIAVASGKGGVGKSTVAANLAVAFAKLGAKVGMLDADIYGPSIPTMFGVVGKKPLIEGKMLIPLEKYGVKLMSIGLLTDTNAAVAWRGPMLSSAIKQFMHDVKWDELDYMIFDFPPGTGDVQITIAQSLSITGCVLVTTPQEVAIADVIRAAGMFEKFKTPMLGLVENMSYFALPDKTKEYIFGKGGGKKLAEEKGWPFLGEIALTKGIRESGDVGKPFVVSSSGDDLGFTNLAEKVAQQVAIRNATIAPSVKLEI